MHLVGDLVEVVKDVGVADQVREPCDSTRTMISPHLCADATGEGIGGYADFTRAGRGLYPVHQLTPWPAGQTVWHGARREGMAAAPAAPPLRSDVRAMALAAVQLLS